MTFPNRSHLVSRKTLLSLGLLVLGAAIWILPACSAQSEGQEAAAGSDVLATIDGKPVDKSAVEAEATEGLKQAEMQKLQCESNYQRSRHQVMETTLQKVVRDRLVEKEAEARGVTSEELLDTEVTTKSPEVTAADVDAFYTENQAQIRQPKERVEPQIRQYLERQKKEELYETFMASLEKKNNVVYKLGPYRIDVEPGPAPAKGPDSAPVKIVEFSDFECPYCSRIVPSVEKVIENYGDKVQVSFRHFPLNFHANAQKASEASMCAADQGKFWEMHDLMFAEQQQLSVEQLKEKAARLELDTAKFNECLDSGKYFQAVQDDMQAGVLAGVSGTPAMFINGRFVNGAQPYESIAKIIDEELERVN